jgi:hypothetical protein
MLAMKKTKSLMNQAAIKIWEFCSPLLRTLPSVYLNDERQSGITGDKKDSEKSELQILELAPESITLQGIHNPYQTDKKEA